MPEEKKKTAIKINKKVSILYEKDSGKIVNYAFSNVLEQDIPHNTQTHGQLKVEHSLDMLNKLHRYAVIDGELVLDGLGVMSLVVDKEEIPADGKSVATFTVKKMDRFGDLMGSSSDNDEITIFTSRGSLSSLKKNLVNGTASFTLKSVPETVSSTVRVMSRNFGSKTLQVRFAPVEE